MRTNGEIKVGATSPPWDLWHDGGDVYHIQACDPAALPDEDGAQFMLADNVIGEANARLIAAAPDLLAACKQFAAWDEDAHGTERAASELRRCMAAAISKAEGRTR